MHAQVGSGYSYKELLDFNLKLKSRWQKTQPPTVLVSKEKPDIWIDPLKSAILQVFIADNSMESILQTCIMNSYMI